MKDHLQNIEIALDAMSHALIEIKEKSDHRQEDAQLSLLIEQVAILDRKIETMCHPEMAGQVDTLKKGIDTFHEEFLTRIPSDWFEITTGAIEKLQQTVEQSQQPVVKHQHTIDFKGSKSSLVSAVLFVLLMFSFIMNGYQFGNNKKLKDNDLKYRYILMHGGIDGTELNTLQEVFYRKRDKKVIKKIRLNVEDFEYRVKKEAELQEKLRLLGE